MTYILVLLTVASYCTNMYFYSPNKFNGCKQVESAVYIEKDKEEIVRRIRQAKEENSEIVALIKCNKGNCAEANYTISEEKVGDKVYTIKISD